MKYTAPVLLFVVLAVAAFYLLLPRPNAFELACDARAREQHFEAGASHQLCRELGARFFSGEAPVQALQPAAVGAPALAVDSRVRFVAIFRPAEAAAFAYCYFVFRGWFDPAAVTPKQLASSASGFAILRTELKGYPEWLATAPGTACTDSLHKDLGVAPADLEREMGSSVSIIAFNPVGAISPGAGAADVMKEALLTVNHERIHAIQVSCSGVERAAQAHWKGMTKAERDHLATEHASYDWKNETVAVREAYAFAFEGNPRRVQETAGACF